MLSKFEKKFLFTFVTHDVPIVEVNMKSFEKMDTVSGVYNVLFQCIQIFNGGYKDLHVLTTFLLT